MRFCDIPCNLYFSVRAILQASSYGVGWVVVVAHKILLSAPVLWFGDLGPRDWD